jgi:hypothetical protein
MYYVSPVVSYISEATEIQYTCTCTCTCIQMYMYTCTCMYSKINQYRVNFMMSSRKYSATGNTTFGIVNIGALPMGYRLIAILITLGSYLASNSKLLNRKTHRSTERTSQRLG